MSSLQKYTSGALAKTTKSNEIIDAVNSIISMQVVQGGVGSASKFEYAQGGSTLTIGQIKPVNDNNSGGGSDDDGGGGGVYDYDDDYQGGGGGYDLPTLTQRTITICSNGQAETISIYVLS